MTLTRSYPISEGYPTALDVRRLDAGLIVREGVFPDPTTVLAAGVAYGNGGWNVGAVAFVAALKRGGAAYSLGYGVARLVNDAAGTAWTIDAAPVSNSRIDLLWIRATDPDEGEATSGTDGPGGVARAVPVFGYTAGTAASSPVAPALPSGALLIATVTTPSGAASIAGSTIVQSFDFAQAAGGILYGRTFAEISAKPGVIGDEAVTLTAYQRYRYSGSAWEVAPYELRQTVTFTSSGTFSKATYPWLRAIKVTCVGGGGGGGGGNGSATVGQGGGGGGGTAESFITDIAALSASVTVTVGGGGAGSSSSGGGGVASSFGSAVIGAAGSGANFDGGAGGSGSTGDRTFGGNGGGSGGNDTSNQSGQGGGSSRGGGGRGLAPFTVSTGGNDGLNFGGGGGGARVRSGTGAAGGNGAQGVVIVELFA